MGFFSLLGVEFLVCHGCVLLSLGSAVEAVRAHEALISMQGGCMVIKKKTKWSRTCEEEKKDRLCVSFGGREGRKEGRKEG